MEICLAGIARKKQSFNLLETIDIVGGGFDLKSPVEAVFKFSQQAENVYTMFGSMNTLVETACNRCGKLISIALDQHFEYVLRVEEEPVYSDDYQCSDEECDTLFLTEASLDSNEILREQILLAVPLRQLCDYSCKGLCKKCGINLNDNKCQCGEINENSPFAILKTLQKK
jgi:uncharacterized protein